MAPSNTVNLLSAAIVSQSDLVRLLREIEQFDGQYAQAALQKRVKSEAVVVSAHTSLGSEPSGYTTMQAWVDYLMTYGYKIPGDKRVVIVPNTNPDGIASGSRNNANNVNIDRNFATANWKADIETNNGLLVNGGGTSAVSEPETAAVAALTRQLVPRLEVSFHSQGRLVGANKYGDSVAIGAVYASAVGYATMFYDAEAVMGYPMTGEYEDWMGESMGIPAILVELPSSSGNYLNAQLNALMKMLSV